MSSWKLLRLAVPVAVVVLLAIGVALAHRARAEAPRIQQDSYGGTLDPGHG